MEDTRYLILHRTGCERWGLSVPRPKRAVAPSEQAALSIKLTPAGLVTLTGQLFSHVEYGAEVDPLVSLQHDRSRWSQRLRFDG